MGRPSLDASRLAPQGYMPAGSMPCSAENARRRLVAALSVPGSSCPMPHSCSPSPTPCDLQYSRIMDSARSSSCQKRVCSAEGRGWCGPFLVMNGR
ncbi:hypothetical protein DDE84_04430 [Bifidobacterium tibiigranuli]|uniref:Uncharacterized protein n=1 Tax=Bifidobacterium tibiigranuli TaxID=2172043 RepID=A0A5N6S2F7_9BIFI|nr:hypothetical protein DDE84_04430 [Bifidobacterium tibiigranuli]KAE8128906.1 hypothetical protein DDF78_04220 [Bifidobacterium tibiigranuli]